jgi:4-amino-4-deoxy-L-arabinose transferase-like glycosyltransferase
MLTAFGTGTVFSARIISTDVPLTFFLALALLAYVRLLQRADRLWGSSAYSAARSLQFRVSERSTDL